MSSARACAHASGWVLRGEDFVSDRECTTVKRFDFAVAVGLVSELGQVRERRR
ncbi:MAG: hypothetical protein ACLP0L_06975 [Solirubrobacteraceae bacterium]